MNSKDNFHVFFHRDFDGICSAAVFLAYAKLQFLLPQSNVELVPVDYNINEKWASEPLPKPSAVVDFLYHPDADWWFDHHHTTFARQDWEFSFRPDERHVWNTTYRSCPRLIVDSMADTDLRDQLKAPFKEYLEWCDIIDSAQYESARQVVECGQPALQINLSLAVDRSPEYLKRLVELFGRESLSEVANSEDVHPKFQRAVQWQADALEYLKEVADVRDGVVSCDLTSRKGMFSRYGAYYLWPETRFLVAVYTDGKGFRLTISTNPWRTFEGPDLSALAREYGGGGHPRVAGISVSTRKRALQIGVEIAEILRGKRNYFHQLSLRDEVIRQTH